MFYVRYSGLLFLSYIVVNLITRVVLLSISTVDVSMGLELTKVFALGLVNDTITYCALLLPLFLILLLPWKSGSKALKVSFFLFFAVYMGIFLFTALAEYFFWEEFQCRFNFIAVDYLVYTTEVVNNIVESYPVLPLVGGIALISLGLTWLLCKNFIPTAANSLELPRWRWRAALLAGLAVLNIGFFCLYTPPLPSANNANQELSLNGVYQLFSAYRNNQLDYRTFYPILDEQEALALVRAHLEQPSTRFLPLTPGKPLTLADIRREVLPQGPEKRLNVVQIVIESLGAAALDERTPVLNALKDQSLYFSNMLATGTRTVRGLEALTLSIPPTPGSSMVRRPGNSQLFTIGTPFQVRGYDTTFLYGGYGYFDNMNAFFAGNGFNIIDRNIIPAAETTFGNAWGICDGDLYNAALKAADASYAQGKPFFQFVLTTTNHRPFTYPEGKVDIASGTSRSGAIKYTDYAIGEFLRQAATKPWFDNTLFVIVSDHTAGSAGKTEIPPMGYPIPCLFYSPKHVPARVIPTLSSQIDVPTTLLALLDFNYSSAFFGKNLLELPPEQGRAFIGTYQLLGMLDQNHLAVLAPRQKPLVTTYSLTAPDFTPTEAQNPALLHQTQALYQCAQDLFTDGFLKK